MSEVHGRHAGLRWWMYVSIAAVALAFRLIAVWAIPCARVGSPDPNYAPDETAHLEEVSLLAEGNLVGWPKTGSIYAAFPPSNDAAQVATLWLGRTLGVAQLGERFPPEPPYARGYAWARLGSALISSLACLFFAFAVALLADSAICGLVTGLACAMYPQFIFIGSYTNPDAQSICAGAAVFAALARWSRMGEGDAGFIGAGAAVGALLATKLSGYFLLPATGLIMLWAVARRRVGVTTVALAALACLAIGLPGFVLNAIRNQGDPLGLALYRRFLSNVWHPHVWSEDPSPMETTLTVLPHSAYGVFGNMNLFLPDYQYRVYGVLLVAGLLVGVSRVARASSPDKRLAAWVAGSVFSNFALVFYNMWFVDFQPQGRYIELSALLMLCVAVAAPLARGGWWRLVPVGLLSMLGITAVTMERILFIQGR